MTKPASVRETEVPLYFLPQAIARMIREKGNRVYRISVKRTHWHHYHVAVRTRPLHREFRITKDPEPEEYPGEGRRAPDGRFRPEGMQ